MESFKDLAESLDALSQHGRLRRLVARDFDGCRIVDATGHAMVNFGGNDYLGLAAESSRAEESVGSPTAGGSVAGGSVAGGSVAGGSVASGSGASALVCGWSSQHDRLANQLAEFESTEAAVVFPTGYAACSGTIATLARQNDLILSDQLNHASLIDGCRLSRANKIVYRHRDCDQVESLLRSHRDRHDRVWIVTDGVFSMDGHLAPLPELCELAQRCGANLIVDEAHGTGILGNGGRGACEALGVHDQVAIRIGTLSKAIGSQGGFVAGPRVVIDYLINRCRPLIYSTALAPKAVAAAIAGLSVIQQQPQRRQRLHSLAKRLRAHLNVASEGIDAQVPIIPWIVGRDDMTVAMAQELARGGWYVPAIRPPTVPEGTARLRISISAAHDDSMIDDLAGAMRAAGEPKW